MKFIPEETIESFFKKITASEVPYVLIKNVSNELPSGLKDGKDIDILVHHDFVSAFETFMKENDFEKQIPPLGRENGWNFAYKLPEYQFWKLKNREFTLYIDASFKLSCKSLTPKMWIPLDECINKDIWEKKKYDGKNHWWIMDDESVLIYLLVRSIFDKKEFREGYIQGIEQRKDLLKKENVQQKLSKVFFKYTPVLIQQVNAAAYENIISSYLTFMEY